MKLSSKLSKRKNMMQRSLDERKRKLQNLEKVKHLCEAQARMQVYGQISITEEQKVVMKKTTI